MSQTCNSVRYDMAAIRPTEVVLRAPFEREKG